MKKKLLSVLAIVALSVMLFGVYGKGSASQEVVPAIEYKVSADGSCLELAYEVTVYPTSTGRSTQGQPTGTGTWVLPTLRNPLGLPLCAPTRVATVTPWLTLPNVRTLISTGGSIRTNTGTITVSPTNIPTATRTPSAPAWIQFAFYGLYLQSNDLVVGNMECSYYDLQGNSHSVVLPWGSNQDWHRFDGGVQGYCLGQLYGNVNNAGHNVGWYIKVQVSNDVVWKNSDYVFDFNYVGAAFNVQVQPTVGTFRNVDITGWNKQTSGTWYDSGQYVELYYHFVWSYAGILPTGTPVPTATGITPTATGACFDPNVDPDDEPLFGFYPPTIWHGPCTDLVPGIEIPLSQAVRDFIPILPEVISIPELGICIEWVVYTVSVLGVDLTWLLFAVVLLETAAYIMNELRS